MSGFDHEQHKNNLFEISICRIILKNYICLPAFCPLDSDPAIPLNFYILAFFIKRAVFGKYFSY